jgi:hypothetical protein
MTGIAKNPAGKKQLAADASSPVLWRDDAPIIVWPPNSAA